MRRRAFLAAGATGSAAALSGCLGLFGSSDTGQEWDLPADPDPADGYAPAYGDPASRDVDESQFQTTETNGETVTLAPLDAVQYWHQTQGARFVDARGPDQYESAHIYGAVLSPATRNSSGGGIADWSEDDRIVCYCGCPHHLSSLRAAGLQKAGYENVYVFDEGFYEWRDQNLPLSGGEFDSDQSYVVAGEVAAQYAGDYAWAETTVADKREAAPIRDDGSFELHLRFTGLTDDTQVRVATPEFDVTRPLGELTETTLTA
ncbi:rhodanese-like domain-containing protein [Halobacterium jilantaiense]|uniref:Rhodanese-related sulfurtransferase n=1 Tax=Halobacterium jilantaiense TaxID=355548 RepID=A0A1I0QCU7_9EURY|nr:rhodanese-like domain-containing protein [Halobacterium jilantaiense]SEW24880.1 Rhodanese-related sulfurtransferase [Halobacterium jilantaiense]